MSMRNEIVEDEGYVKDAIMDLDQINRDLVECHSQVLWKRPQAYQEIIESMEKCMSRFWDMAGRDEKYGGERGEVYRLHRSMNSRMEFYRAKLKGIESYAHTTLERLTIQRAAVSFPLPPPFSSSSLFLPLFRVSASSFSGLTMPPAVQYHRSEGIQAQSRDGRATAAPRPCQQAR